MNIYDNERRILERVAKTLKPCPFCGSKAEYYGECDMVMVRCSDYDCYAQRSGWFDEPEDAADDWNRRPPNLPLTKEQIMGMPDDDAAFIVKRNCKDEDANCVRVWSIEEIKFDMTKGLFNCNAQLVFAAKPTAADIKAAREGK